MAMAKPKILLTGATGYIGGTVLHHISISDHPYLKDSAVTLLVRSQDKAQKLRARYGDRISTITFQGLDDIATIKTVSSQHDVIINCASGFHPPSAEAMVKGLSERKKVTRRDVWMIHTSGCSNIADKPLTGQAYPNREWNDANAEAVYAFEKSENEKEWYAQRAAELLVLDTSIALGVKAVSLQSPGIFGQGEGFFQNAALIIPIVMRYVLEKGYGFQLGDGTAVIDYVHVSDLADLYVLCLLNILDTERKGGDIPTGRAGIIFPTNGRVKMRDIAQGCVDVAFAAGALPREGTPKEKEIRQVSLEEAATTTAGNLAVAEAGWGGHRLTKGVVAREQLGWKPSRGEEAWQKDLEDELKLVVAGKRGVTIDGCIAEGKSGGKA